MTAYFDRFESALRAVDLDAPSALDQLAALDRQIVRDVTIAAMIPAVPASGDRVARGPCPTEYRHAIAQLILKHSLEGQIVTFERRPGPDYEDAQDYLRGLGRMACDMHSLFHCLAADPRWPYGDGPEAPISALLGDGEDERELLREEIDPGSREATEAPTRTAEDSEQPPEVLRTAEEERDAAIMTAIEMEEVAGCDLRAMRGPGYYAGRDAAGLPVLLRAETPAGLARIGAAAGVAKWSGPHASLADAGKAVDAEGA